LLSQRALGGVGAAELALKRVPEGIDALMQALAIARAHDDPVHEAKWLAEIAESLSSFGYHEDALRNSIDGLAVARRIDDEALQVSLLALTGKLQQQLGQSTRARESYTKALDLAKKADLPADQMRMMANLGNMALATRQWAQAATLFSQALHLAEQLGDRVMAARLHGRLGQIAQEQRDPAGALEHYRRAVDEADLGDDPQVAQKALASLAAAQHRADDPVAANTYRRALNAAQNLGDKREEAILRVNLGTYLADQGQAQEALEHLYAAAALARGFGPEGDEIYRRATEMAERLDDGSGRSGGPRSWGSYAGSGASSATMAPPVAAQPMYARERAPRGGYDAEPRSSFDRRRDSRAYERDAGYGDPSGGYESGGYAAVDERGGYPGGYEPAYGGYGDEGYAPPSGYRGSAYGEMPVAAEPRLQRWDEVADESAGTWAAPAGYAPVRRGEPATYAPDAGYYAPEPDYPADLDYPYGSDEMYGEETLPPE